MAKESFTPWAQPSFQAWRQPAPLTPAQQLAAGLRGAPEFGSFGAKPIPDFPQQPSPAAPPPLSPDKAAVLDAIAQGERLRAQAAAPAPAPMPAVAPAPRAFVGGGAPAPRGPSSFQIGQEAAMAKVEGAAQLGEAQLEAIDIQRNVAQQQAAFLAEQQKAEADRLKEETQRAAQYQADVDSRLTELDALQAEVRATKIDPSQYFSSQPAWAKVLSLISVGLGGFAQGYTRGALPNVALQQLNDAVERDIMAQRANLETKKSAVAQAQSLYGIARQRFQDDRAAAEWAKAQQKDMIATAFRRFEAEARDPELANKARQLAVQFETDAKVGKLGVAQAGAAEQERQRAMAAQAARGPSLKERLALEMTQAQIAKTRAEATQIESKLGAPPEGMQLVSYEGQSYLVPREAAKELQEQAGSAMATKSLVKDLVSLGGGSGFYGPGSTKYEDFMPKKGALAASWAKTLAGGFNPSAAMEERAQQDITLPPRTDMFGAQKQWRTRMESIPEEADRLVRARFEAAGAMPVSTRRTGAAQREYAPAAELQTQPIQHYGARK